MPRLARRRGTRSQRRRPRYNSPPNTPAIVPEDKQAHRATDGELAHRRAGVRQDTVFVFVQQRDDAHHDARSDAC